jgi:hypothetical protein
VLCDDGFDRLYRLYFEVVRGVAMRDSSLDLTADERRSWRDMTDSMLTNPAPEGTHYALDVE